MVSGANLIYDTFRKFGLKCHVGTTNKKSKTEAMFFPAARSDQGPADRSEFNMGGGKVHFVEQFQYLGSIVHESLDDAFDVDNRIKAAGAAFGALKTIFGCKTVPLKSKGALYDSAVLELLLHGSEAWTIKKALLRRLKNFHNACVRRMCRINRWHSREYRIRQTCLEKRLSLRPMDTVLRQKQLRWAGHVARMDGSRFPRKLISGWVANPRRRGRPQQSYGHSLANALKEAGIDKANWISIAQDRRLWRSMI